MSQLKIEIAEIVAAAAGKALGENVSSAEIEIERPKNADHGDFATSIALKRAKAAGRKPREVAEAIAAALGSHAEDRAGRCRRARVHQRPLTAAETRIVNIVRRTW